jgi:hypothetical protein
MIELALRRHVAAEILSSFKKKRPKQLPKSTDDDASKTLLHVQATDDSSFCIRVFV